MLEVRGLVGEPSVGRRVRPVEPVAGEEGHQVEHLVGDPVRHAARDSAGDEPLLLLVHDRLVLLAHRAAKKVGASQAVAGQHLGDLHHLFLVDDDPVGVGQDRCQLRVDVGDLLPPVLAVDEVVDHPALERAGPIERHGGDDVLELVRLELLEDLAEAARLELEHPGGVAARDHLVDRRIVHRDPVDVELGAGRADEPDRRVDDRQRLEAEEVELDQAGLLRLLHGELGDDFAILPAEAGHPVPQRLVGDDHPGGVHPGVPVQPLERRGDIEQLADLHVRLIELLQLRLLLDRVPDRRRLALHRLGHQLGQPVGVGVGDLHHPGDVADDAARLELVKRRDLPDVLHAVFPLDVLDDLLAPVHAEIDVEVRHRDALRVEEALEQELEGDRIDVGDAQRVRHQRAGARSASRPDRDAVVLGPLDEVGDDEEVAGELHPLDDVELGPAAGAVLVRVERLAEGGLLAEAPLEALRHLRLEVAVERVPFGHLEFGQARVVQLERDVAALRDLDGALQRLRHVFERRRHLGRALDEVGVGRVLEALLVGDGLAGLDRHQDLVRARVGPVDVVAVVGGDQRDPQLGPHAPVLVVELILLRQPVRHHLEVEVAVGEQALVLERGLLRLGDPLLEQGLGHLAAEAGRQADEALRVVAQDLLVDPRVVVEALQVPHRVEVGQVLVADLVLGQEDEVEVAPVGPVLAVGRRDVGLAAEDELDALLLGGGVEVHRAEHVAVVGDRDRVHAELEDAGEEILHPDRSVEQAVLRVQMKVGELRHSSRVSDGKTT